jgi:hypothetical protein
MRQGRGRRNLMSKTVWLITGAGRGMGTDIAKAALAAGHAVVATGRDPERVAAADHRPPVPASPQRAAPRLTHTRRIECVACAHTYALAEILTRSPGGLIAVSRSCSAALPSTPREAGSPIRRDVIIIAAMSILYTDCLFRLSCMQPATGISHIVSNRCFSVTGMHSICPAASAPRDR